MKKLLVGLLALTTITASAKETEITLTETNHIALRDIVTTESVAVIKERVNKLKNNEPLYLFIDSPGGSVIDGIELVDILQHTNKNVTCIARKAISMAFSIFQACPTRLVTPYAILMQHRVSAGAEGNPDQIRTSADLGKDLEDVLNESDANRLGLPVKDFKEKIRYEFWLVGSKKILANKAADSSTIVKCTPELASKEDIVRVNLGFISFEYKRNKCPL